MYIMASSSSRGSMWSDRALMGESDVQEEGT